MRKFLIAGNWKMNGSSVRNRELVAGILGSLQPIASVEVLICPPMPYLATVSGQLEGQPVMLGAQNVSEHGQGAVTGETAADMLSDVGCSHVIVGHSERRALFAETNEAVAQKFAAAQGAGLVPVLCVGETLAEREAGNTELVVGQQLAAVIDNCGVEALHRAVIAYEPVWAIGTGQVATPEQAQGVHRFVRGEIAARDQAVAAGVQILYGGSMKGENASGLLCMPDIDGGLIGGASLKAADFLAIVEAAGNI